MRLKNKKTGEIIEFDAILPVKDVAGDSVAHLEYGSLAELNEEWEDYKEPKEYWAIDCFSTDGDIVSQFTGSSDIILENRKSIGNYFSSREEAELAVRKFKAWKRLKDNGVVFDGCFDRFGETHNHRDVVVFLLRVEAPDGGEKLNDKIEDDLDLLFLGGEE